MAAENCTDRIRYTLSDAAGELAFSTFEFVGGGACPEAEKKLCTYLLGRPLASVDLKIVERLSCANGQECFAQIAAAIRDHQDFFVLGSD